MNKENGDCVDRTVMSAAIVADLNKRLLYPAVVS